MYEVFVSNEAEKYYKKLEKDTKRRINKCIDVISNEPFFGFHIKRLHGELEGKYRYESGGLRIIYEIDKKNKNVEIKAIRSRGDVYKK
ncbi:MAG: type II toxin-antitoxin system RelE/ParE family toxin [Candidatus Stahlbacteria bacterium]|nr:type II toxin-antitoxin system RelE/ParE family toxin [Candidatus Stahlbacteria bacterium]